MKNGDFIRIDFVGKIASTGEIFDFTEAKIAKDKNMFNPERRYDPAFVILGDKMVIPGMEKELLKMKPGEEKEFSVKPEEAFGQRNPKLVKIFPVFNFIKQNITPTPGTFLEIDGMHGKVQSFSGGRVRIDFNHPLAGKELRYRVKINEAIHEPIEKIKALFSYYNIKYTPKLENDVLTLESEKQLPHEIRKFTEEITLKWVKEVKKINFAEKSGD